MHHAREFRREVAKYPPDQKQSAVMALLAIVQKEPGLCQRRERSAGRGVSGHAADRGARGHDLLQHVQPAARWGKYKLNVCTNLPCQLRRWRQALHHLEHKLGISMGETTADGMFTLQQSECLGACADSPVMLVNDRTMCSFMTNDKLDQQGRWRG
jgi:NADH-quinone oxidoreductase subunit E